MVNATLKDCRIYYFGQHGHWSMEKVADWIKNASGQRSTTLGNDTTHVLVPEKDWLKQSKLVKEVLEHKAKGHDIHILKYEWLEESINKKRHLSEAKYSWEKADAKGQSNNKEPRSQAGLVKNLFTDATDGFVDAREHQRIRKQEIDARKELEEDEARKRLDFERRRANIRVGDVAAVFRRGAQRARSEILSDNHHIYMDTTGFSYDISMTKVDTKNNQNERYVLTVFESNAWPATYAVNCQYAATGKEKTNNIIAALGSTLETALHSFRKIFKEKTQVNWEDRVKAAVERNKKEKDGDLPQGDFADAPYLYHPPLYGSRGEMAQPPEVGQAVAENTAQRQSGSSPTSDSTPASSQTKDNSQYDASDMDRFIRETQGYAQKSTEDLVEDAFEDPFNFGKPETYTDTSNGIGTGDQSQSLEHTQVSDSARDNFDQLQQGETVLGKRKATDEILSEGNAASKKPDTDKAIQQFSRGNDNMTSQYSFDGASGQVFSQSAFSQEAGNVDFSDIGFDGASQVH